MKNLYLQFIPFRVFVMSIAFGVVLTAFSPLSSHAVTMGDAVKKAVSVLKNRGLSSQNDFEMILEIVNYDSKKVDREALILQGELFSALQNGFPEAKIILQSEAIAGVSGRAVFLMGTYQQRGGTVYLVLQAINQTSGQLIAKADVDYESERIVAGDMVAVLNLQATNLSATQVKIFSRVFRSELAKTGKMDLIASEYIDSADADRIQEEYQCSREECGTIIAQQLNASQVVTPIFEKVTENLCYLVASWKEIASGRTLNEVSIEHNCNLETLGKAMEELACKLASTCGSEPLIRPIVMPEPETIPDEPKPEPMRESSPRVSDPGTTSETYESVVLLSFAIPLSYSFGEIKVTGADSFESTSYSVDPDGSPTGSYIHMAFGDSRFVMGFSYLTLSQPLANSDDWELNINAFDLDWTWLIGGHLALGFGAGANFSNILCDSCFFEPGFGIQFSGKIGFIGSGFGVIYSMHMIESSSTRSYKDQAGTEQEETFSWSGTASMLALVIRF